MPFCPSYYRNFNVQVNQREKDADFRETCHCITALVLKTRSEFPPQLK